MKNFLVRKNGKVILIIAAAVGVLLIAPTSSATSPPPTHYSFIGTITNVEKQLKPPPDPNFECIGCFEPGDYLITVTIERILEDKTPSWYQKIDETYKARFPQPETSKTFNFYIKTNTLVPTAGSRVKAIGSVSPDDNQDEISNIEYVDWFGRSIAFINTYRWYSLALILVILTLLFVHFVITPRRIKRLREKTPT